MPDQICRLIAGKDMSELFPKTETKIGEVALEGEESVRGRVPRHQFSRCTGGRSSGSAGLVGRGRSELVRAIYGVNDKFMTGKFTWTGKDQNRIP